MRNLVPDKKTGDFLNHEEVNEVYRRVNKVPDMPKGYVDDELNVTGRQWSAYHFWTQAFNNTGSIVPAYSIFGIVNSGTFENDEATLYIEEHGHHDGASPFTLFTNGPNEIPRNGYGRVRPIGYNEPTDVRWVGGTAPRPGHSCGAAPSSFGVEINRTGLVCTETGGTIDGINVVRVVQSLGEAVVGRVVQTITPYDSSLRTFGFGLIRVEYRDSLNVARRATDPATLTKPWVILVYNICGTQYNLGDFLKADPTAGVGYVVEDPCSSSPSSSTSLPSVSASGSSSGTSSGSGVSSSGGSSASRSASSGSGSEQSQSSQSGSGSGGSSAGSQPSGGSGSGGDSGSSLADCPDPYNGDKTVVTEVDCSIAGMICFSIETWRFRDGRFCQVVDSELKCCDTGGGGGGSGSGTPPTSTSAGSESIGSTPGTPTIAVTGIQRNIGVGPSQSDPADGGSYNLGITETNQTYGLTIENTGSGDLTVSVTQTGTLWQSVSPSGSTVISAGATQVFTLTVVSSTSGSQVTGTISIDHDDTSEPNDPYEFDVVSNEIESP